MNEQDQNCNISTERSSEQEETDNRPENENVCKGLKRNGQQCTRRTRNANGYCFQHGDPCPACYEGTTLRDILPCRHRVHLDCIRQSMKPECPLCRAPLELPPEILANIRQNASDMEERIFEDYMNEDFASFLNHNLIIDLQSRTFACEACISTDLDGMMFIMQQQLT